MQNIAKRNSTEVTDVTAETARVSKMTISADVWLLIVKRGVLY